MFVAGKNVNMFTAALPLFFIVQFVEKNQEVTLSQCLYMFY